MGLDYHYDNSPRDIQQQVFTRQLRLAIKAGKPLTIHTREAEEDTERILKAEVPKDWKIHIHCYTDSPEWATRMLSHFPNLYIGITGVITYATNLNTRIVAQQHPTRLLLETDAPFMVPSNLAGSLAEVLGDPGVKNLRFPLSHSAMIPWTAEFVVGCLKDKPKGGERQGEDGEEEWTVERVMRVANENAKKVYGIQL
ncbi:Metallo-dependent hydrolase [Panus rudis PR-1116 ss-1]|nr:Metallo-dependent hydrolase [Panus rudis PR-1116 ss-1]